MTSKKLPYVILLTILVSLIICIWAIKNRDNQDFYEISVIIRGNNHETWSAVRSGMEQAARELNVDLSFVALSIENDPQEQVGLIERELYYGADALIIAPADSTYLLPTLLKPEVIIPIVTIESPLENDLAVCHISADNCLMGEQLATAININHPGAKIILLSNNSESLSFRQREVGLVRALSNAGFMLEIWPVDKDTSKADIYLRQRLSIFKSLDKNNIMVALDASMLEIAVQALSDANMQDQIKLYGIGTSTKIASYLDKGHIQSTVVQNDYSMGYLAVSCAIEALNKQKVSDYTLKSVLIDSENMYSKDNQLLVFPLVK